MRQSDFIRVLEQFHLARLPRMFGNPNQTLIKSYKSLFILLDEFNGKTPCFLSANSFKIRNGVIDKVIMEKIFIDFDGEKSYRDLIRVKEFLDEYDITYTICYSGNKGYHLNILLEPEEWEIDMKLSSMIRSLFTYLKNNLNLLTIDFRVAEWRRLQRIPFTKHEKSGRYCVPIPEKLIYDEDSIMDLSVNPKLYGRYIYGNISPKFSMIFDILDVEIKESIIDTEIEYNPFIIPDNKLGKFIYELIPQKCIANAIFMSNPSHFVRFSFVSWLKYLGYSLSEAVSICNEIGSKYWMDYDEKMTTYQVTNIYTKNYYIPSCNRLMAEGLCIGKEKCNWG